MGFRKLLVTLDGSNLAATAVEYAMRVAEPGSHIHLLSVLGYDRSDQFVSVANSVEIAFTGAPAYPIVNRPTQSTELTQTKVYLDKVKEHIVEHGFTVSVEAMTGVVVDTIVDEAARLNVDAIVMVTHGRTGFSKLVLGSVAEGVLHKAPCPVLLIPEKSTSL